MKTKTKLTWRDKEVLIAEHLMGFIWIRDTSNGVGHRWLEEKAQSSKVSKDYQTRNAATGDEPIASIIGYDLVPIYHKNRTAAMELLVRLGTLHQCVTLSQNISFAPGWDCTIACIDLDDGEKESRPWKLIEVQEMTIAEAITEATYQFLLWKQVRGS